MKKKKRNSWSAWSTDLSSDETIKTADLFDYIKMRYRTLQTNLKMIQQKL